MNTTPPKRIIVASGLIRDARDHLSGMLPTMILLGRYGRKLVHQTRMNRTE